MKKLIPVFLTGFFIITSANTNVLANEVIESAEFTKTNISVSKWMPDDENTPFHLSPLGHHVVTNNLQLNRNLLGVQMAGSDDIVYFVSHTEVAEILLALDRWGESFEVNWNEEDNVIEILNSWFIGASISIIEDPIDMETINFNEWININFVLVASEYLEEQSYRISAHGIHETITFERFNLETFESEELFTSVMGCNISKVRVISPIVLDHDAEIAIPFHIGVNIEDLKNSNTFTEDEISIMLELRERYVTADALQLSRMFDHIEEIITSGSFSDEDLANIIDLIEQVLLNPTELTVPRGIGIPVLTGTLIAENPSARIR